MDVYNGARPDVEQPYDFHVQLLGPFFDASGPGHLRTDDFAAEGRQAFCDAPKVCDRSELLKSQKTVTKDNYAFGDNYENYLASRGDLRIKVSYESSWCIVRARRIQNR